MMTPFNNKCLDCGLVVAKDDRQEWAYDKKARLRRRCEPCIEKLINDSPSRLPVSTSNGRMNIFGG